MLKFDIYFAGLARNCDDVLENNLSKLIQLCNNDLVKNCAILVAENDSDDRTKDILAKYESQFEFFKVYTFDGIDSRYPVREDRIAFLREYLLNIVKFMSSSEVGKNTTELYVPIDLDSQIAQSLSINEFLKASKRVINSDVSGVFPVSEPVYYDIYALRATEWVEYDCWNKVEQSRWKFGSFIAQYKYIYSNQLSPDKLSVCDTIPVESAFGGVGIYDIAKVSSSHYMNDTRSDDSSCEHVKFNKSIDKLVIDTDFSVQAPTEHVRYHSSFKNKLYIFIRAVVGDFLRILKILIHTLSDNI